MTPGWASEGFSRSPGAMSGVTVFARRAAICPGVPTSTDLQLPAIECGKEHRTTCRTSDRCPDCSIEYARRYARVLARKIYAKRRAARAARETK